MKILNLYSGIGGNRKLWGNEHDITAVEIDPEIAKVYSDYFPDDKMVIGDAHQYLLDHFKEFDFIWSSPPCPSHSRANYWANFGKNRKITYPDMSLYQEVILLRNYTRRAMWVVENVVPYYNPLIPAVEVDRHLFWSNFSIWSRNSLPKTKPFNMMTNGDWEEYYGFDLSVYIMPKKLKVLRNCVHPETGLYILECATGAINSKTEQGTLFEATP